MGCASVAAPVDQPASITALSLAIDPERPDHRQFGRLRYLNGWVLSSANPEFGGYSALDVDGDTFLALSDFGHFVRFRLRGSGVVDQVSFAKLPEGPGHRGTKADSDSEAMVVDRARNMAWVSFEQYNAIFRFSADLGSVQARATPTAMEKWPSNGGPESMTRLRDGRFVILAEDAIAGENGRQGLLFAGDLTAPDAQPIRFSYQPPDRYVPTDIAQLPDGKLLVLNRHYTVIDGVWAALTLIDPAALREGAELKGELIAEFRKPYAIDNMEALAVTHDQGRTILWIMSDDNVSALQRTLLLKFALEDSPAIR